MLSRMQSIKFTGHSYLRILRFINADSGIVKVSILNKIQPDFTNEAKVGLPRDCRHRSDARKAGKLAMYVM